MPVHERPYTPPPPPAARPPEAAGPDQPRRRRRGPTYRGMIPASAPGHILLILIPLVAVALIVLSVLGTFYGIQGDPAPLARPGLLLRDLWTGWPLLLAALGVQFGLGMAQWGGRSLAEDDPRWWVLYALSLATSAWLNWVAYGPPLMDMGMPWLLAAAMVVVGDILPEVALVQPRER